MASEKRGEQCGGREASYPEQHIRFAWCWLCTQRYTDGAVLFDAFLFRDETVLGGRDRDPREISSPVREERLENDGQLC